LGGQHSAIQRNGRPKPKLASRFAQRSPQAGTVPPATAREHSGGTRSAHDGRKNKKRHLNDPSRAVQPPEPHNIHGRCSHETRPAQASKRYLAEHGIFGEAARKATAIIQLLGPASRRFPVPLNAGPENMARQTDATVHVG